MTDQLDALVANYLARLRAAVSDLPESDRQQIVEQISEHISSARSALPQQTEAGVRDVLERLGTPEEIATEARAENGLREKKSRTSTILFGVVIVAAVVLGLALAAALGAFSGSSTHGAMATTTTSTAGSFTEGSMPTAVPVVTGVDLTTATKSLDNVGLKYTIRYIASAQPVGFVLAQLPSEGSVVKRGTEITLTVSGSQTGLTVPDLIGLSQAQAQAELSAVGLNMTVAATVSNLHVPLGVVASQSPSAGAKAPRGSAVSVVISAGPGS